MTQNNKVSQYSYDAEKLMELQMRILKVAGIFFDDFS